ncbi:MAG: SIMPL domain-containing protein [Candidatus Paceibacterota bacterium]|jgi:hypothetical protein
MEELCKNKRFANVLIILLLSGSLFLLGLFFNAAKQHSFIGRDIQALTTISVTGEGESFVTPDTAELSFSVSKDAKTYTVAQETTTENINKIVAYLKEMKIDEKDIKTTEYSVYPKYEYQKAVTCLDYNMNGYCPEGKQILVGYTVSQSVDLKIRKDNLDKVGAILVAIGEKGATNISGLTFTVDDKKTAEEEVRNKAILDAQEKAKVLAEKLGVSLTRVVNYSEGGAMPYYDRAAGGMMKTMSLSAPEAAPAPSIPTGENKFTSTVTITYEIQ